jgi:hypothetical protein
LRGSDARREFGSGPASLRLLLRRLSDAGSEARIAIQKEKNLVLFIDG